MKSARILTRRRPRAAAQLEPRSKRQFATQRKKVTVNHSPTPLIFAVNMLLHTTAGDTFTFAEIADRLKEAGFVNQRFLEGPAPSPLVLARRP